MTAAPLDATQDPVSAPVTLDSYAPLLGAEIEELRALAKPLAGKEVTMVNSTRVGGGVAELLHRMVPLLEELGLRPRWEVMAGDQDFFEVTKAFHNALHGSLAPLPSACVRHLPLLYRLQSFAPAPGFRIHGHPRPAAGRFDRRPPGGCGALDLALPHRSFEPLA